MNLKSSNLALYHKSNLIKEFPPQLWKQMSKQTNKQKRQERISKLKQWEIGDSIESYFCDK